MSVSHGHSIIGGIEYDGGGCVKKTSYELLTGKKPNVSYFRVFGARCRIKDPHHTSKFAPKAHEGFMLGYGKDSCVDKPRTKHGLKNQEI